MRYSHDDKIDTYTTWQQAQKIPINRGFFIEDLKKVEVAPWEHKGGLGAFVNLDGTGGTNDGYVCEIPPGKQLKEQKHLYEEMVYVLDGHGATSIWQKDGKKHTFACNDGKWTETVSLTTGAAGWRNVAIVGGAGGTLQAVRLG